MATQHIDGVIHRIGERSYVEECRSALATNGALVLSGFFTDGAIAQIVEESAPCEVNAFYTSSTHNVYVTAGDPTLPNDHPMNRQQRSNKGLIADDEIPMNSPLREVYNDVDFQAFLSGVLDVEQLFPYADPMSSINVHFASEGQELGWHFDNSAFAVTMLLQAPVGGAEFEYVPDVRNADAGEMAFDAVRAVLDGITDVKRLTFRPGDLVLFRGRNALHRVTPTKGPVTRLLAVFAYNERPGVALATSSMLTFYGRVEGRAEAPAPILLDG